MPPRTRACSICRKKRIKCDGTLPQCLMCKRTRKVCPGPLEGPLIVDMTTIAKNGMKRRRTMESRSILCAQSMSVQHLDVEPLAQPAITIAFYESFLNQFTSEGEDEDIQNKLTWLQRLPHLAMKQSEKALILALEATATAYGAIMSSDTAMTRHAQDLYGLALHAHKNILQKCGSGGDVTIHMVSATVLLSFFEAMQATTADAYQAHIYGAVRLLEITGPGECAHGVLCQLFYHVRTQMLFVQVAMGSCNIPVSAKKILYDTLLYTDPPMIQKIMCCIAALQDLQAGNERQTEAFAEIHGSLTLQVDRLWNEYNAQENERCTKESGLFRNAFTALTFAYFSAAYILLEALWPGLKQSADLSRRCQAILDIANLLEISTNAIAYMRMATLLLLVALHAPIREDRERAKGIFKTWSDKSMRGISALALDAVCRGQYAGSAGT